MTRWTLDPKDISVSWRQGTIPGHPGGRAREIELTVTHRPTGLSVSKSAPWARYTRKQSSEIREQMERELSAQLEVLVAKHLRVPGL